MKKFLINAGIAGALALGVFAAPSQASAIFNFTSNGSNCSGTGCGVATSGGGPSGILTGLTISDWTQFTVQVGSVTETWDLSAGTSLSYASGFFTLTGTASCDSLSSSLCGTKTTGASTTLLTFAAANPGTFTQTGLSPNQKESITIGTPTSITEAAIFMNTLGLTTPTGVPTSFNSSAVSVSGDISSPYTLTASSSMSMTVNQAFATPEPVSFALFGSGLLAVAFFARRRQGLAAAVQVK
jgi:hypothetical protein